MKSAKIKNNTDSAKKAVYLLRKTLNNSHAKRQEDLLDKLNEIKQKIFSSSKTNPLVRNALNYILYNIKEKNEEKTKAELRNRISYVLDHLNNSIYYLAEIGHQKIKKGAIVYTHGHSSSILNILLKAKRIGTNFEVHNTEVKPFSTGRAMAEELARHNIHVKQHADLALRIALKNADLVLLGADTISEHGQVYASIGSELIAETAEKYDIPVYICTDSWKFSPFVVNEYEKNKKLRSDKEIWSKPPKRVVIMNYGFEKVNPKLITGIITERGIFKPHYLVAEIRKQCPWMFRT